MSSRVVLTKGQIETAQAFTAKEAGRYALTSMLVIPGKGIMATDGRVLVRVAPSRSSHPDDFPEMGQEPRKSGGDDQFTMPATMAKKILKNFSKSPRPITQEALLDIDTGGKDAQARCCDLEGAFVKISSKSSEESFPETIEDTISARRGNDRYVTLGAQYLQAILNGAKKAESDVITFRFSEAGWKPTLPEETNNKALYCEDRVHFRYTGSYRDENAEGLIMPVDEASLNVLDGVQ